MSLFDVQHHWWMPLNVLTPYCLTLGPRGTLCNAVACDAQCTTESLHSLSRMSIITLPSCVTFSRSQNLRRAKKVWLYRGLNPRPVLAVPQYRAQSAIKVSRIITPIQTCFLRSTRLNSPGQAEMEPASTNETDGCSVITLLSKLLSFLWCTRDVLTP